MSMERSRRDRFAAPNAAVELERPLVVVLVALAVLFLIAMTPLVTQALIAELIAGAGAAWPSSHVGSALLGLVHGHFGAGLPAADAHRLPDDGWMWTFTVVAEVLVASAVMVLGVWARDVVAGNSRHGLATAAQAAEALGLPRLRKSAGVVRPDLYARTKGRR